MHRSHSVIHATKYPAPLINWRPIPKPEPSPFQSRYELPEIVAVYRELIRLDRVPRLVRRIQ